MPDPQPRPLHAPFTCRLAGVSFRQAACAQLNVGDVCTAIAEDNPADPYAVRVDGPGGDTLGYIPARTGLARRLRAAGDGPWPGTVVDLYDPPSPDRPRSVSVRINPADTLADHPVAAGDALAHWGWLTADEVAHLLGGGPRAAAAAVRAGRLIAAKHRGRTVYPAFQFDGATILPTIAVLRPALADAGLTGPAALAWLATPNAALNGAAPADVLADRGPEVLAAVPGAETPAATRTPAPAATVSVYTPSGRLLGLGRASSAGILVGDGADARLYPADAVITRAAS